MKWSLVDNEVYSENAGRFYRHCTADENESYIEQGSPIPVAFIPDGYQIKKKTIDAKSAKRLIAIAAKSEMS